MKMLLSLILATVGRNVELERCLSSLCLDGCDDFEIVIVDQNQSDDVQRICAQFAKRLRIRYLRQQVPAASTARNLGAGFATGEWIGFPDDDAQFLPETLVALRTRIQSGACDVISGMTCDEAGVSTQVKWRQIETAISRRHLRSTVAESTLFLRRDLFLSNKGFDPIFGPGGAFGAEEAIDLIRRLHDAIPVERMRFYPDIRVVHADSSPYGDESALRKTRTYARARGACFARHWRTASLLRIFSEVTRHMVGAIVLRERRRRSRVECLIGYVEGFVTYQVMQAERKKTLRKQQRSVVTESV